MNPILLDFPQEFTTERLLIRCPQAGDGAVVNAAICDSADSLKPWLPFADPIPTLESSEEDIRRAHAKWLMREDLRLLIFDKHTGAFVGSSGLHRINWQAGRFEIGYWLRDAESGKGLMTEAVDGIVTFAARYLNAKRIEIRCDSRNERSRRVAERSGFHIEATLRQNSVDVDGQWCDTLVFAKLKLTDGSWGYSSSES